MLDISEKSKSWVIRRSLGHPMSNSGVYWRNFHDHREKLCFYASKFSPVKKPVLTVWSILFVKRFWLILLACCNRAMQQQKIKALQFLKKLILHKTKEKFWDLRSLFCNINWFQLFENLLSYIELNDYFKIHCYLIQIFSI